MDLDRPAFEEQRPLRLREELTERTVAAQARVELRALADAAIIELVLPDLDGIEVCRLLRECSDMTIIMLSTVGEESAKVRALRAGADDYVTTPFGSNELVARLEAGYGARLRSPWSR